MDDESRATSPMVFEASRYRYMVEVPGQRVSSVEPDDLFEPDPETRSASTSHEARGSLLTRNRTGTLEVVVRTAAGGTLVGLLEINSRKLDAATQYRWMLSGIAADGAELLLRSFAPTSVTMAADVTANPETLYQQVAFLSAILKRPHTVEAFERVLRAPHVSYVDTEIELPIGRGVPGSSSAVRSMLRPGRRLPSRSGLVVDTVPEQVIDGRSHATIDNPPNRFVRFVVERWAAVLHQATIGLGDDSGEYESADRRRGRREVDELIDIVEGWRTDRRLRDVGRLTEMPSGNQVIHRRAGYREIHQAFLESQAAAMLQWDGNDDVHRAGLQDVAQLYEYWCYLELRRLVERLCDFSESSTLVSLSDDGMHLRLRRGNEQVVSGSLTHAGRPIDVDLWFNKSFRKGDESWSVQLRPDCSLRLAAQAFDNTSVETWLHFDAKYRVNAKGELFVDDDVPAKAKRDDLLKMHAYRDAIHRSAGSYVLFPGTGDGERFPEFREVLPGLGAFPFVPGSDGHATAATASVVERFLEEVMDHIANQATNRERAAWWRDTANRRAVPSRASTFVPLERPPADTSVLVGYYRTPEHLDWISQCRLYNLRLGDRRGAVTVTGAEASARILVLWSANDERVQAWTLSDHLEVLDAEDLHRLAYPSAPTGRYLCRLLGEPMDPQPQVDRDLLASLSPTGEHGAPFTCTWMDLLSARVP